MNATSTSVATATAEQAPRVVKQRRGRLTPEQVRDAFLSTESSKKCARRLGVSHAQIVYIRNRKCWKELTADLQRPTTTTDERT